MKAGIHALLFVSFLIVSLNVNTNFETIINFQIILIIMMITIIYIYI